MNQRLLVYANDVAYNVDMYDSEPIEVVKSIFDIENPEQRKADYTKTIKIPGTSNNNKIFSFIFDLARFTINDTTTQFNPDFNAALKTSAILYRNEIVQIKGYIQLMDVLKNPDGSVDYNIVIIGELASLYKDMGEAKLTALDMSEYNHTLNITNINTLSNTSDDGYCYPIIDVGLSPNESSFFVDQLSPAIFLKAIVDKIFSTYGYVYDSDFFNSEMFKKLVLWAGDNPEQYLTDVQIFNRTFLAQQTTDTSYTDIQLNAAAAALKTIIFPTVFKQSTPSGYDNSTGWFTIQDAGFYRFALNGEIYIRNTGALNGIPYYAQVSIVKFDGVSVQPIIIQTLGIPPLATNGFQDFPINLEMTSDQFFNVNESVFVTISMPTNPGNQFEWKIATVNTPMLFRDIPSTRKYEGVTVNLTRFFPVDMTQAEFMTNLKNCFNLYFEPDPDIPNKLRIEPRDEYYTQTVFDLTNKVDYSQEINIKPLELSKYRTYIYSFDKDNDEYNTYYNNISEYAYGYRKFDVVNDFATETKNIKVSFAPTPLSDTPGWHTRIFSKVRYKGSNGVVTPKSAKGRLLHINNLSAGVGTNIVYILSRTTSAVSYPVYQYAGHLDDPLSPTIDLNFGSPTVLYYDASGYTTNNLFNKYWRKNILELTDPDSKVVELKAKLNEVELKDMTFDKLYLIDRQYFRLQQMTYDANNIGTVSLRLLKVLKYNNWSTAGVTPINGGSGDFIDGAGDVLGDMPVFDLFQTKGGNNTNNQTNQTIYGEGNSQGAFTDNSIVNSKDNMFSAEYVNILAGGDNEVYAPGVGLFGCSGYTSSLEGEQVINNIQQPFMLTYDLASSQIVDAHNTPIQILNKIAGYYLEVYDAYAQLTSGETYTSAVTYLDYDTNSAGSNGLLHWANTFLSNGNAFQRGALVTHPTLREEGVVWKAASSPGTGTGSIRLTVHYRLIPT